MGRWTQFDQDSHRLSEGLKRIAYDADTQVYTFRDDKGKLYRGSPGEEYGILTPIRTSIIDRPYAFDTGNAHRRQFSTNSGSNPSSFHDILPSSRIAAERAPVDGKTGPPAPHSSRPSRSRTDDDRPSPRERFVTAVRRMALPKMQGVVHNLRRSKTSIPRRSVVTEETDKLLGRHPSMSTTRSCPVGT